MELAEEQGGSLRLRAVKFEEDEGRGQNAYLIVPPCRQSVRLEQVKIPTLSRQRTAGQGWGPR